MTKKIDKNIDIIIDELPTLLHKKIELIGVVKSAEICKLKHSDISAWMNGRRIWSIEKMIRIYKTL